MSYIEAVSELRTNPGQWRVFESRGNCVVMAGPGSGKTKTLTVKMARILSEEVEYPRGVACITFCDECARDTRRRLRSVGVTPGRNSFVGTAHSFCLKNILLPYARMAGVPLPDPIAVATHDQQLASRQMAVESLRDDGLPLDKWDPEAERYRRWVVNPTEADPVGDHVVLHRLSSAYQRALRSRGLVDFDDMVLLGFEMVREHSWVRQLIRCRFPVLMVDEYQDLGPTLHQIVKMLCFDGGVRLLAFGDPDQSIYEFSGAKPELLRKLADTPNVEPITLGLNYRCGRTIVRASQIALGEDRRYRTPRNSPQGTVDFHECPGGIEQQASFICDELIPDICDRHVDRNTQIGDIAILYPSINEGDVIARAVARSHTPFVRIDNNAPYRKTALTRWVEDCANWCIAGWRSGEPCLGDLIRTWTSFVIGSQPSAPELPIRRDLVRFLWSQRDQNPPLEQWVQDLDRTCLSTMLSNAPQLADEGVAWTALKSACEEGRPLGGLPLSVFAGQTGARTHLNLITLHRAKGREFFAVVLFGMDQDRIPGWRFTPREREEKRRLFYVGLTRAQQEVHLTYSGWTTDRYERIHRNGPSEFLSDLRQKLLCE